MVLPACGMLPCAAARCRGQSVFDICRRSERRITAATSSLPLKLWSLRTRRVRGASAGASDVTSSHSTFAACDPRIRRRVIATPVPARGAEPGLIIFTARRRHNPGPCSCSSSRQGMDNETSFFDLWPPNIGEPRPEPLYHSPFWAGSSVRCKAICLSLWYPSFKIRSRARPASILRLDHCLAHLTVLLLIQ